MQTALTYTLASNFENLTLTGSAAIDGTGNNLANVVTGNSGNNHLTGGSSGNDTLNGNGGNDTLDGGNGADDLQGGAGDDYYIVDTTDLVTEGSNKGIDTVQSTGTHTLADNVENLILWSTLTSSGTGNALNNAITGNSGINILMGLGGNDTMTGGGGNDNQTGGTGRITSSSPRPRRALIPSTTSTRSRAGQPRATCWNLPAF